MKLTILVPNLNLRGGTRVVLDYSTHLMELGVHVTVVFPTRLRRPMFPLNEMEYLWRAPAWQTAEAAARYPTDRGERYYFIQDIETYGAGERAAQTYRLPFRRIVISPWVRSQLHARFGVDAHALVPNGLDLELYRPGPRSGRPDRIVLGALHDPAPKKGSWNRRAR